MSFERQWTIELPGVGAGFGSRALAFEPERGSLLVADGWEVAFAALRVRRLDARSGRPIAEVRTRKSVRALGRGADSARSLYFLCDKDILVHDVDTLEPMATHSSRVPRYANAIVAVEARVVALAAPKRLVEYELGSGKSRRASEVPAVAIGAVDGGFVAVLADGSVAVRTSSWGPAGRFAAPQYTGCVDAASGWIVALAGKRPSPYDADGMPQPVQWPRSRVVHLGNARGDWRPEVKELPFDALVAGVCGGRIVAVGAQGDRTALASVPVGEPVAPWRVDTIVGRFEGFAGSYGVFTSGFPQTTGDSVTLTMHTWQSR